MAGFVVFFAIGFTDFSSLIDSNSGEVIAEEVFLAFGVALALGLDLVLVAATFGVSTFGVSTFGVSTFGVSTFGVSTFGVSTFGVSTFGVSTLVFSDLTILLILILGLFLVFINASDVKIIEL
ncbi:MAG: hypothetical protein KAZ94_02425 [Burkholderiales bacterium]|nr:hypothetical protein [Burkholderiales bacterium]